MVNLFQIEFQLVAEMNFVASFIVRVGMKNYEFA